MTTPYPASEFDDWAGTYDQNVTRDAFPFTGYAQTLAAVVHLAAPAPGLSVLDLGTGTGNLARLFLDLGCQVTATDFSTAMLDKASQRLPGVELVQADLSQPLPPHLLDRVFDRIVSAYVFHHFDLAEKNAILRRLSTRLAAGGRLVIADISFPDQAALEAVKQAAGGDWDEEEYWLAADAVPLLERSGFTVAYHQTSPCAGVYVLNLND